MTPNEIIYHTDDFHVIVQHDPDCSSPFEDDLGFEFNFNIPRHLGVSSAAFPTDLSDYWLWPVYGYVHSGVALSLTPFSCLFDSGVAGYIAVKRPSRGGEWRTRKAFLSYAEACIETFNAYLAESCYGFKVIETDTDTVVDSCWGFIGFDHEKSGLYEYGKDSCDYYQAEYNKT